ncbi:MAG: hypothetical protein KF814_05305 [Nitrospiraceae bacterium]|nr:hypothetical protein [Nitrospiraceae bacterium]
MPIRCNRTDGSTAINLPSLSSSVRSVVTVLLILGLFPAGTAWVGAVEPSAIKEHREAMLKDAEDMIAHGGMGDAKAIVYHCGEVSQHAQAIMKDLPAKDPQVKPAISLLQDAIRHCRRVQQIGDKADPGASLNPASKARNAVREAVHLLRTLQDHSA